MFATLIGDYPRVLDDGTDLAELERGLRTGRVAADAYAAASDELVREVIADQEAAGLELVSDGWVRHDDPAGWALQSLGAPAAGTGRAGLGLVDEWAFAARAAQVTVKQALVGPYTLGMRRGMEDRDAWTIETATVLNGELRALAAAGCAVVEVHEPRAVDIGSDERERALFREAHLRLLDGIDGHGLHASLALMGGDVAPAGAETLLAAPYASVAFDLLGGPDGWRVIARTPGQRGVICGVLPVAASARGDLALMVWAAHYAASTGGRGVARVGLATAGGLRHLTRAEAAARLERLGEAARLAVGDEPNGLAGALIAAAAADSEQLPDGAGPGRAVAAQGGVRDGSPRTRIVRGLPGAPVPGRPPRPRRSKAT